MSSAGNLIIILTKFGRGKTFRPRLTKYCRPCNPGGVDACDRSIAICVHFVRLTWSFGRHRRISEHFLSKPYLPPATELSWSWVAGAWTQAISHKAKATP